MIINFSEEELDTIANIATERQRKKNRGGVPTKKVSKRLSDWDLHYIGLKGEFAVAKFLEIGVDARNFYGGDGGTDSSFGGSTVDVKFSAGDMLKLNRVSDFRSDIAIFVRPATDTEHDSRIKNSRFSYTGCDIIGWTTRVVFAACHTTRDFGYGQKVVMHESALFPIDELRKVGQ